jgi:ribosomal protein L10
MKIRAGYIDGKVIKPADLKAMASLPPRKVLLSQFGAAQQPLTKFAGVLHRGS